jgi:predicted Ser/Thr protein kinase
MNAERWREVDRLYHSALEREPGERAAFLAQACQGDEQLRRELDELLAQDSPSDDILERPAADLLADSTVTQLTAGTQLGPYKIEAVLGEGGMGQVYRAVDTRLDRYVAIKISSERFNTRFEREARAIAALNHPHICTLYDVGPNYLVMELVEGETLAARLRKGALPMEQVLRYGCQIAGALAAAHAQGITHRDLKPANIMVTKSGVKVLDFGLAKMAPSPNAPETQTLTATQAVIGTPAYMAPEQLEGKACDARSDIFSFGLVLYEMAAGKRAFSGDGQVALIAEVMRCDPAPLTGSPAQFAHVVERCLTKDPEQRWQTARDLKAELEWTGGDARIEIEDLGRTQASVPLRAAGSPSRLPRWPVVLASVAAAFGAGVWWHSFLVPPEARWSGVRLGGSAVALGPRISPDGQLLAFQAMVDSLTQVAVMKPESGNWTVLTHDRSRGYVSEICWSRDSTKLYFDRVQGVAQGIFSVPVLGGEERLVVEDASMPQILPDGSLLMVRLNAERRGQLHRVWPETGRVQPLKALIRTNGAPPTYRVTPRGDRVVFFGTLPESPNAPDYLYSMALTSESTIRLRAGATIPVTTPFAIAAAADGRSVYFGLGSGDLRRIVSVPIDGSEGTRTLLSLTTATGFLDVGSDGSLYADQWERPLEVVRFSPFGGTVEQIGEAAETLTLPLPDGRIVFASRTAGRQRLLAAGKGKEAVPLVETQADTTTPAALIGQTQVAFIMGSGPNQTIAIASSSDGRLVRRLNGPKGSDITSMATFADGKTIFYTASGSVWAIPASDGQPQRLGSGDSVTADPGQNELIVRLDEREGVRLVRMPLNGGPQRPVRVEEGVRPVSGGDALGPTAVGIDGKVLLQVAAGPSWFWPAGVLDPRTGKVQILRIGYPADMPAPGWTPDGKIVAVALPLRSSLWRFRLAGIGNEPRSAP